MSQQYFKNTDSKNILFIFNNLAKTKDINKLSKDDIKFFNNSNLRLKNYLKNLRSEESIFDFSIEPINYIEIINSYLLKERLSDDIITYSTDLLNNFDKNDIEKNTNFLKYISKEKNSLIPLWN